MQAFFHCDKMRNPVKVSQKTFKDLSMNPSGISLIQGRAIWDDILASGSARYADKWLEATRLERFYGKVENVRSMFNKVSTASDPH